MSCTEEFGFLLILRAAIVFYKSSKLFPKHKTQTLKLPAVPKVSYSLFLRITSDIHILFQASQPVSLHYHSLEIQETNFRKIFMEKGNSTMNNGSASKNRWGLHLKGRKERDNEDLHLFREMHKRDKERTACLLLPVDDLEHSNSGTQQLHDLHHSNHSEFC